MSNFVEVRGIIIAADDIQWIEYLTAEQLKARERGTEAPSEPEGRTYVLLKSAPGLLHWLVGDVRGEFRALLAPRCTP